jgi:peptidoglycan/LPS O-acetylase OafA/YrhL
LLPKLVRATYAWQALRGVKEGEDVTAATARSGAAGPTAGRLAGLSGLRGVAALAIVTGHVWDSGSPDGTRPDVGWFEHIRDLLSLSVVLFFSLSGFLLYRRFAAAILRLGPEPDITDFAKGRALRIIPTYWVILFVCGIVLSAGMYRDASGDLALGNLLEHPWTLAANAAFVQNLIPQTMVTGLGPAWTLLIELWFYLVMPLIALPVILYARGRRWRARVALAFAPPLVLLATGLSAKTAAEKFPALGSGGWGPDWGSVFQRSFVYHADLFAAGMSAAAVSVLIANGTIRLSVHVQRLTIATSAALFVLVPWLDVHKLYPDVLYEATMSGVFALLMTALATGRHGLAAAAFEWRWLVLVGTASYSMFLWHEPIILLLSKHDLTMAGAAGIPVNLALVLAVVVPLSLLSYRWVEAPSMALRKRRLRAESRTLGTWPARPKGSDVG